jgi:hypothetical protein
VAKLQAAIGADLAGAVEHLRSAAVPIDIGDAIADYVAMAAQTRSLLSNLENWQRSGMDLRSDRVLLRNRWGPHSLRGHDSS